MKPVANLNGALIAFFEDALVGAHQLRRGAQHACGVHIQNHIIRRLARPGFQPRMGALYFALSSERQMFCRPALFRLLATSIRRFGFCFIWPKLWPENEAGVS